MRDGTNKGLGFVALAILLVLGLGTTGAIAHPPSATAAKTQVAEFYVGTARGVVCVIEDEPDNVEVVCYSTRPGFSQKAMLDAGGGLSLCAVHGRESEIRCQLGNAGERTPTLNAGRRITIGRFRCLVLHAGVRCTVIATGKGFLMTADKTVPVGGASIHPAPVHLPNFLSPDRKVWCGIGEGREAFCGTGGSGMSSNEPQSLATLGNDGKVTLCSVAVPTANDSCIQNWDANAPILRYGQVSELDGAHCTSAPNGITCTTVAGAGAGTGKGFRVSKDEAVRVG
jgi:hypothetical protein